MTTNNNPEILNGTGRQRRTLYTLAAAVILSGACSSESQVSSSPTPVPEWALPTPFDSQQTFPPIESETFNPPTEDIDGSSAFIEDVYEDETDLEPEAPSLQEQFSVFAESLPAPPEDVHSSLGIDPAVMPTTAITLDGTMYDPEDTTDYKYITTASIVDGVLSIESHPDLDVPTQKLFERLIVDSADLITSAYDQGRLTHVMITTTSSEEEFSNSHYNRYADSGLVALNIHETGVSYEELEATLRHELWHAASDNLPFSKDAWQIIWEQVCDDVDDEYKSDVISYTRETVQMIIDYLEVNKEEYPEDYAEYMESLENVADYMDEEGSDLPLDDIFLYSCGQYLFLYGLRGIEALAENLEEDSYLEDLFLRYEGVFEQLEPNNEFALRIFREIAEFSGALKALNESTYLQTESASGGRLGHVSTNFSERMASTLNNLTYFTNDFAEHVASLPQADQDYVLAQTRQIINEAMAANPSLLGLLSASEARFMATLHSAQN